VASNGHPADDLPAIPLVTVVQPATGLDLRFDPKLQPPPATEVPPVLIQDGWRIVFLTTSYTWMCSTPLSLLGAQPVAVTQYCDYVQWPDDRPPPNRQLIAAAQLERLGSPWKRNYSGIFSAHVVPDRKFGQEIIAVAHGENKNEVVGGQSYQNSVDTNVSVAACFSGIHGNQYADCYDAYNAFISISTAPYAEKYNWGRGNFQDDGPAIWPSAGYVTAAGAKISDGVRHPSSIIKDGYLYIFYLDGGTFGFADIPGRKKGIKVARAPLPATGAPRGFVPYFQGGFNLANTSLPTGFHAARISRFYAVPGGKADTLFDDSDKSFRFSVAHIRGTASYAGVDEYCDYTQRAKSMCELRLRLSHDLLHWGPPTAISTTIVSQWSDERLHYPIFMDAAGTTNDEIDAGDFWVLGTSTDYKLEAIHLRLSNKDL
jgi:hypothetical protein